MNAMNLEDLNYTVPPSCQGQIVEVAYASTPEGIIQRITDRSDQSVSYYGVDWDEVEGNFEPWNREPTVDSDAWVKLEPDADGCAELA